LGRAGDCYFSLCRLCKNFANIKVYQKEFNDLKSKKFYDNILAGIQLFEEVKDSVILVICHLNFGKILSVLSSRQYLWQRSDQLSESKEILPEGLGDPGESQE
jgi:hypothetical protein